MAEEYGKCVSCKKQITKETFGGNYYHDEYCKECWEHSKKYIGRSWGGEEMIGDIHYEFRFLCTEISF